MRKALLPALLFSASMFAQKASYIAVSVGADIKNSITGSAPTNNKPSLNWITKADFVGANVHVIMGYESFDKIKFSRAFSGLGYEFDLYGNIGYNTIKTTVVPSLEASMIQRAYTEKYQYKGEQYSEQNKAGFLALGINLDLQWDLTDCIVLRTSTNIIQRPDKEYLYNESNRWVLSNYMSLVYKFNKN